MRAAKHLTPSQLDELRGALEAEKDALEEELAEHGRIVDDEGTWQGASMLEGEEADPNDAADAIEELATNMPLVAELEARHKDVLDALEKMDNDTYGICEKTGNEIPYDRLEANPAARTIIVR